MVGIVSYGAYLPRPRLTRMSAYQSMGWFAPALIMSAQGERTFCNWDEDSVTMAVAAAQDCLQGLDKAMLAGVYLASTTPPFADRSNAGIVKTALNLRDDLTAADFSASLKAGTTALLAALDAAAAGAKRVLVVGADKRETKAAGFPELFNGDGAAAVLIGGDGVIAEFLGAHTISVDFVDHYRGAQAKFDYGWEERWVRDEGYGKLLPAAIQGLCKKLSLGAGDIDKLAYPCPFKAEHRRLAAKFGLAPEKLVDGMHDTVGETGAAHPLLLLARALEQAKPGERIVVAGFGQGCDALAFRVTDQIKALAPRRGVAGALANKTTVDNYAKFLKFRNLMQTETGIRAEAPTQTAMTALWRKRGMILGLVGGRCPTCGTPQFPKTNICVNPKCLAVGPQEDYEFAARPATVKTFTGDMLAVSMDPPAIYGMVQFEGGGRMMADFTDCELADVKVGQPVTMSFRRRYVDEQRGFSGYFWKAVPVPAAAGAKKAEPAAPGMTVADVFAAMPKAFRADKAAGVDVVFQYKLSGPQGGEWHLVVKDGAVTINQGAHASPTTTLLMSDEDFVKITQGKLNAMEAFTTGKLKVEGDLMKSQLLGKLFRF
jgi:3-hydroxy-3-methylglutaryl CoA synthase/putative sterol carrier protein